MCGAPLVMRETVARKVLRLYARVRRTTVRGVAADFVYTRVTPDDAAELVATVVAGFETYRTFAPPNWNPPPEVGSLDVTRRRLGDDDVWGLLARTGSGEPAGHITFSASTRSRWPGGADDLAHLWQLFVRQRYWGTGVATSLHRSALQEAARQAYAAMRLYTPTAQARARRFYEREGWVLEGDSPESPMGMPLVEYRRRLPDQ
jgi:GNAT superfamily N-acetyltransferase